MKETINTYLNKFFSQKFQKFFNIDKKDSNENYDLFNKNSFLSTSSEQVCVNNFESIQELKVFLSDFDILNIIEKSNKVVFSNTHVQNFDGFMNNELNNLSRCCTKISIVLLIFSKENNKFFLYWKSKFIQHFLIFRIYKGYDFFHDIRIFRFLAEFLVLSLKKGHLGLHNKASLKVTENFYELHLLADHRNYNLLLVAAEHGDAYFVRFMLNGGFESETYGTNAQILAWNSRHFDVLLILLQNNLTFPPSMNIEECPENLKIFYNINKELTEAILAKNKTKVLEILEKNPTMTYFYNLKNESALTFALKSKSFKIYRLLIANHVKFGPHENFVALKKHMKLNELEKLKDIHFKESKFLPENHLRILLSNSRLSHDTVNIREKFDKIQRAFEALNSNPNIQIILMIVAASRNFRIIFDFNKDSVEVIDPTADSSTKGLFYITGRIYIGAKELLDERNEHKVFGTLAHELCHYAMNLVFKNSAKPYKKDDFFMKKRFDKILRHIEINSVKEDIIFDLFRCYPTSMLHAELIVRVPHLIMHYSKQPVMFTNLKRTYDDIFNIFECEIMDQLKTALPKIIENAENEYETNVKKIRLLSAFSIFMVLLCCSSFIFLGFLNSPLRSYDKFSKQHQLAIKPLALGKLTSSDFIHIINGTIIDLNGLENNSLIIKSCKTLREKLLQIYQYSNYSKELRNLNLENVIAPNTSTYNALVFKQILDDLDKMIISSNHKSQIIVHSDINPTELFSLLFKEHDYINFEWQNNTELQVYLEGLITSCFCSQFTLTKSNVLDTSLNVHNSNNNNCNDDGM